MSNGRMYGLPTGEWIKIVIYVIVGLSVYFTTINKINETLVRLTVLVERNTEDIKTLREVLEEHDIQIGDLDREKQDRR